LRAVKKKPGRRTTAPTLSARLNDRVTLQIEADGRIAAEVDGYPVELGKFDAAAAKRAAALRAGLPIASASSAGSPVNQEIAALVRRLARRGLLEYRLAAARGEKDIVVIEPQVADYWPQRAKLNNTDTVVLSRFAYLRRRGADMVLESSRAGALFRICDPQIASFLAELSKPQKIATLRRQRGFPGIELFGLLLDCEILLKVDGKNGDGLRPSEGDANLVLWDFHDLLFHTRSTEGRQANPLGGIYPYADMMAPLPAERPRWPGRTIDLVRFGAVSAPSQPGSGLAKLLRERHSIRDFDETHPITLAELAQFLDGTARVLSRWESPIDFEGDAPVIAYTGRPYPSAGSAHELELYLAVNNCEGLPRGFYHYDAGGHALVPIEVAAHQLNAMLTAAQFATDAPGLPQILITIAARFGRVSWKYSSIAYSLVLKNVGGLVQTFYLMATDMGLGGCALGTNNIELFANMTGLKFHVEGPVGQFALGRGVKTEA